MSRNARNGENGEKSPASGEVNWMPEVAPWRLAISAKMAILAKITFIYEDKLLRLRRNKKEPKKLFL